MNQTITNIRNSNRQTLFHLHAPRYLIFAGLMIAVIVVCSATINAKGTLDPLFGTGGKVITNIVSDYADTMLVQPDGKIILVGTTYGNPGTGVDFALVRYNSDGSLDTLFGTGGKVLVDISNLDNVAEAAVLQTDGKIVVVGHIHPPSPSAGSDFALARINSNGSLDGTFGTGGIITLDFSARDLAYDVGLQSTGKIIVIGSSEVPSNSNIVIARYDTNGSLDASFGVGGMRITDVGSGTDDFVSAMTIQTDDKIVVGGSSNLAMTLLRYDSTGTLDSGFGTGGIVTTNYGLGEYVADVVVQTDGKIIAAGNLLSGTVNFGLVRFLSNGSLDSGFGTNGKTETDFFGRSDTGYAVALRTDGKIAVAGNVTLDAGGQNLSRFGVVLYNVDGSLAGTADTDFTGYQGFARSVAFQSDGKVLVAGTLSPVPAGINDFGLARYSSVFIARTPFDFDGDGKTDISVYRSGGISHWYDIRSSWFYPQPSRFDDVQFGTTGDLIVPGDYDGDIKTDYAVFRPSTGTWYTSLNPALNYGAFHWGQSGDIPVPGDYDGDGKTDHAIYRPSTGTWWVFRSFDSGFIQQPFGISTDRPVIGDFDGDTKTDFAYVSRSGGSLVWHILQSSNSATVTTQFGIDTDTAVPADYDGDGITNIAVFRASTGRWYTSLNPATYYGEVKWGQSGDIPVPGDYDGDGKADLAVYRPANGGWYVRRSVDLLMLTEGWGLSTDIPVPSAFIPQ